MPNHSPGNHPCRKYCSYSNEESYKFRLLFGKHKQIHTNAVNCIISNNAGNITIKDFSENPNSTKNDCKEEIPNSVSRQKQGGIARHTTKNVRNPVGEIAIFFTGFQICFKTFRGNIIACIKTATEYCGAEKDKY